ncbi:PPK2 family polyphosphate kinase [Rathayibacter soli]|uniref:PPK2 family polyphosphate kinase n=1 Tax=Rathayibacter soli TaxID=3144168 RepID=UPI0027E41A7D|nr:PPK2 family polyphosphate kinase [Glaciibacter superstes]
MAKTATRQHGNWTMDAADALRAGPGFSLAEQDTNAQPGFDGDKSDGARALAAASIRLAELQERLFASSTAGDTRSVLLVLQAMDSAGKGGIVGHVVGVVNPMGVHYTAFKKPTAEELAHDFLWRVRKHVPGAGMLGVFDRSHYEDVLIGRVRNLAAPEEIERRYGAINAFEQELTANGTVVLKVMLHLGKAEQKQRLGERLARPDKYWKYNPGDVDERMLWDDYQAAYQIAIDRTSTPTAPWHVVPADKKWYARLVVQQLLIDALARMNLTWPAADFDVEVEKARLAAS